MPTAAKSRRGFRFGLRTMFVAVTLFACWLGYQVNWIHQRNNFLAEQRERFAAFGELDNYDVNERFLENRYGKSTTQAPAGLWLLGERGHVEIRIMVIDEDPPKEFSAYEDCGRGQHLFPESRIVWYISRESQRRAR